MTSVSRRTAVSLRRSAVLAGVLCVALSVRSSGDAGVDTTVDRFPIRSDGFHLNRATHSGAFFDVIGRRSALFGYENRTFEAWVYPLKIIDDFALSFRLDGYPLDIDGRDIMASIQVRPDSTTLVYAHAEGLPALGDPRAVHVLAGHLVATARHLTVIDLWIESEENRG